jgi:hypothetical protein
MGQELGAGQLAGHNQEPRSRDTRQGTGSRRREEGGLQPLEEKPSKDLSCCFGGSFFDRERQRARSWGKPASVSPSTFRQVPIRVSIQRLAPHQLPHPIPLILPAVSHLASSSLYGCVAHCPSVQAFPAVDSPSARSWSSDRRNLASLEQSDLTSLTAAATRIRSVTWIAAEDKAHLTRKSGNQSAAFLVKRRPHTRHWPCPSSKETFALVLETRRRRTKHPLQTWI